MPGLMGVIRPSHQVFRHCSLAENSIVQNRTILGVFFVNDKVVNRRKIDGNIQNS